MKKTHDRKKEMEGEKKSMTNITKTRERKMKNRSANSHILTMQFTRLS